MKVWVLFVISMSLSSAHAETVWFSTSTNNTPTPTGAMLGAAAISNQPVTIQVQEIAGLEITVHSGSVDHKVSSDSLSIGINVFGEEDEPSRFEADETFFISFSKAVKITAFDFRYFDSGESVAWVRAGQPDLLILYNMLGNKINDTISTNLVLAADEELQLIVYPNADKNIALEAMDLEVIGSTEAAAIQLSISQTNQMTKITAQFDDSAASLYQLQSCANLESNRWVNIEIPFTSPTYWTRNPSQQATFYRVIRSE